METTKADIRSNLRNDQSASIEIFMPITRAWRVDAIAQMLAKLDTTGYHCTLLVCIDSTEITEHYVRNAFEKWEVPFNYRIIHTGAQPAGEVRMATRRDHIRDMLNFSKGHIREDSDMVFMVEDDTDITASALRDLMSNFAHLETAGIKVGLIEGVQVGRHGYRMIGAWRCNDLENPTVMETIPFTRKYLLEKIDGGGLYCFVTPTHLFKSHEFYWHDECFAPDVTYGIELRKQGYENFIDWSVTAGHVQRDLSTLVANENCVVVRYEKQPEGHWLLVNQGKGGIS